MMLYNDIVMQCLPDLGSCKPERLCCQW